jgi:hypothetical protein
MDQSDCIGLYNKKMINKPEIKSCLEQHLYSSRGIYLLLPVPEIISEIQNTLRTAVENLGKEKEIAPSNN